MTRRPNPWIAIPALVTGALGAALGWMISTTSCRLDGRSCTLTAGIVALIAFVAVTVGVAILLALVFRSLAVWRQQNDRS